MPFTGESPSTDATRAPSGDISTRRNTCTSLASDGAGEIDSLFVERDYRGKGLGTELTRRGLEWLDAQKATSKTVAVAFGNDSTLKFYAGFGFLADHITLRQVSITGCQPDGPANRSQPAAPDTNQASAAAVETR